MRNQRQHLLCLPLPKQVVPVGGNMENLEIQKGRSVEAWEGTGKGVERVIE